MKTLVVVLVLLSTQFPLCLSQNVEMDGDLLVGGGNITFADDITAVSPKIVLLSASLGDFTVQTLGSPGSTFYIGRDGDVGINTQVTLTDLHIKQAKTPVFMPDMGIAFDAGLTLESTHGFRSNLFVASDANLHFSFSGIQRSYIDGTNGDYINMSDKRLKTNISPLEDVLPGIENLTPYRYNYIDSESDRSSIGFLAQDVQEHFPDLVHDTGTYKALAYKDFSILAIKAVQEQQKLIEALQSEVAVLKSQIKK